MRRCLPLLLALFLLAGCSMSATPGANREALAFEAELTVNALQELMIIVVVRNTATSRFPGDDNFQGVMELQSRDGMIVRIQVQQLEPIPPEERVSAVSWSGALKAGDYALTWGASGYGATRIPFELVERGGRLALAETVNRTPTPAEAPSIGRYGKAQPLVERAIADLAARRNVQPNEIWVQRVEAHDFPDASLGVPEPGKFYIQVITPGYIIQLTTEGQTYIYHGANERVVLASGASP